MTTFISGGHHLRDSGAVSKDGKITEFKFCSAYRDKQVIELKRQRPDIKIVVDKDYETLGQYLTRITTGNGSVGVEWHLNSSEEIPGKPLATGLEVLIADNHTKESFEMATELADKLSKVYGLRNRGVKTEKQSARGKLAFVRIPGTIALVELGFINNPHDMEKLQDPQLQKIAFEETAKILAKFEDKI